MHRWFRHRYSSFEDRRRLNIWYGRWPSKVVPTGRGCSHEQIRTSPEGSGTSGAAFGCKRCGCHGTGRQKHRGRFPCHLSKCSAPDSLAQTPPAYGNSSRLTCRIASPHASPDFEDQPQELNFRSESFGSLQDLVDRSGPEFPSQFAMKRPRSFEDISPRNQSI